MCGFRGVLKMGCRLYSARPGVLRNLKCGEKEEVDLCGSMWLSEVRPSPIPHLMDEAASTSSTGVSSETIDLPPLSPD